MSYTRNQTRIENDENKIQNLSEDLIKVCKDALELLWNGSVVSLFHYSTLFKSRCSGALKVFERGNRLLRRERSDVFYRKLLDAFTELIGLLRNTEKSVSISDKLFSELTNQWSSYQDEIRRDTFLWSSKWKHCFVHFKKVSRSCSCFLTEW